MSLSLYLSLQGLETVLTLPANAAMLTLPAATSPTLPANRCLRLRERVKSLEDRLPVKGMGFRVCSIRTMQSKPSAGHPMESGRHV